MEYTDLLTELLELSTQVREVAVAAPSGDLLASSGPPDRGRELARVGAELLAAAASLRPGGAPVTRVEASRPGGGVFVVAEGGHTAVATTVAEPTAGLVVYDLRALLRRIDAAASEVAKPTSAPRRRKEPGRDA